MTDAVARWTAKAEHDVTLPTGTVVTISLPDTLDCIVAGGIPLESLTAIEAKARRLVEDPEAADPMSTEDAAVLRAYHRALVRAAVRAVDGQRIDGVLDDDVIAAIPRQDFETLRDLVTRREAPPGEA